MVIRIQENYKTSASAIPCRKNECRINLLTLFNTGGRDLPAPRELNIGTSAAQKKYASNQITALFGAARPLSRGCFLGCDGALRKHWSL